MAHRWHASHGRLWLVSLTVVAMTGCTAWRPADLPPPGSSPHVIASRARLIQSDGDVVEVEGLRLQGDTLHGMTPRVRGARQAVVMPLSRARGLQIRRFSSERTIGMLAAIALFTGAAFLYLWETSGD